MITCRRPRRPLPAPSIHPCVLATAMVLVLGVLAPMASAQAPRQAAGDGSYIGVITANDVYVRSGGGDSYYPFGKLRAGDLVKVQAEKHGWLRVVTAGPAFRGFFGYIRHGHNETCRLEFAENRRTARTSGPTDLLAPNMNTAYAPDGSWKRILQLPAKRELRVLEEMQTDLYEVHKVALPPDATGWVSGTFVNRATPEQIERWREAMAPKTKSAQGPKKPVDASAADDPAKTARAGTPAQPGAADSRTMGEAAAGTPAGDAPRKTDPVLAKAENTVPPPSRPGDSTAKTGAAESAPKATGARGEGTSDPRSTGETKTAAAPASDSASTSRDRSPSGLQARLDRLETAYATLREEPIRTAEVRPLRRLYTDLAEDASQVTGETDAPVGDIRRYALARVEQLTIWADLQKRQLELAKLRQRLGKTADLAGETERALIESGEYTMTGRLATSTLYDGDRLPRLFRIQDTQTGRTIAYLLPMEDVELESMVGELVGLIGPTRQHETLLLEIVEPTRLEVITIEPAG